MYVLYSTSINLQMSIYFRSHHHWNELNKNQRVPSEGMDWLASSGTVLRVLVGCDPQPQGIYITLFPFHLTWEVWKKKKKDVTISEHYCLIHNQSHKARTIRPTETQNLLFTGQLPTQFQCASGLHSRQLAREILHIRCETADWSWQYPVRSNRVCRGFSIRVAGEGNGVPIN